MFTLSKVPGHPEKCQESCRCCGASSWDKFVEGFDFWECKGCGVFVNSREVNAPEVLLDNEINTDWDLLRRDIEKFVPILETIEQNTSKGRIHDIGCSSGYLIWLAKLRGWQSSGNDIDRGAERAAHEMFDLDIQLGHFEDLILRDIVYDAFVFHHGIEHVRSPKYCIGKCLHMLTPTGIIYLAHPMMKNREAVIRHGHKSHQHEWTFESFGNFLRQFPVDILLASPGDTNGPGVPGQTWMVRKRLGK